MPELCLGLESAPSGRYVVSRWWAAVTVEVVVTISPDMFREDVDLLRAWLEKAYPYDWVEAPAPDRADSLSLGDIVIMAAVAGASEVVAKAAVQAINEKIKKLAERYEGRHRALGGADLHDAPPDGSDRDPD